MGEIFKERIERSSSGDLLSVTIKSGVIRANDLNKKDNSSEDKSNYKLVKIGDIAYNSMRMWQGASGYSMYEGIVSPAYTVMVPSPGISYKFMALMFKRHKIISMFKRYSQGLTSDTWNLKFNQLSPIQIKIPELVEQNRIEILLYKFNHLLTLQERKLELLKQLKKTFLQRMFPEHDENVPKIRFSEFHDEWEERKLEDLLEYEQPTDYIVESTCYDSNFSIPVLTAGKSFILGYTAETEGIKHASHDHPIIIFDDFTTTSHFVDFPFKIKSSAMKLLTPRNDTHNSFFLFNILQKIDFVPQGHNRHWISVFSNFEVKVPRNYEQNVIGKFLNKISFLLALQENKVKQLNQAKKLFLQKMFI